MGKYERQILIYLAPESVTVVKANVYITLSSAPRGSGKVAPKVEF